VLQISGSWLHVSAALQPSSGPRTQIKYLQRAYSMGPHSVYNYNVCQIKTTIEKTFAGG